MFTLIAKIFENARAKSDEVEAMCAVSLLMHLLENVKGIDNQLSNIVHFFMQELSVSRTPEYKAMLSQGLAMCFWYAPQAAVQVLEGMNATGNVLSMMFSQLQQLQHDFEIKRFIVGLTSLITADPQQIPQSVQGNYSTIIKALVYLCQKSIQVAEKMMQKRKKEEEAQEDTNAEPSNAICEDEDDEGIELLSEEDDEEDEDYDFQEEECNANLYLSKLDDMDEVLYFRDALNSVQSSNGQLYEYLVSQLDASEQQTLTQAINKAIEWQNAQQ